MDRIFLLSPAHPGGVRAAMLFHPSAGFALARELQRGASRPLGEIFQFLSGLYFRGKLNYVRAFGRPPPGVPAGWVITSSRGLVPTENPTTLDDLREYASVPIDAKETRYRAPLHETATRLAAFASCDIVLLGSISTPKYVEPLLAVFGDRLRFPTDFVGRGDMSRGGLMLRAAREGQELDYQPVQGAVRRGTRPPKLGRWAAPAHPPSGSAPPPRSLKRPMRGRPPAG